MAGVPTSSSRPTIEATPWQELEAILPGEGLRPGTSSDAIAGIVPIRVASPCDERQISAALRWANQHGIRVTVAGGGTKQEWLGAPQKLDLLISTANIAKLVEHAHEDMTATVQTGLTVAQFQAELSKKTQRLALDVLWPERATVGGIIATNDNGALRLRFGSIRDLLIGATVVLASGTIARSGGKVVKNVAGYDLPKLFTGSFGTLGVLTEVTFRVHPLPRSTETLSIRFPDDCSANNFILSVNNSTLVPASVQLRCGTDSPTEVDVRFEGVEAGIAAQVDALLGLAAEGERTQLAKSPWSARQDLWKHDSSGMICKLSVLPSEIAAVIGELRSRCEKFQAVIQATGLGYFSVLCSPASIGPLRSAVTKRSGTLIILRCPPDSSGVDRFGPMPDSLPIMTRVKHRFDPNGILNRGRFLGGI